MDSKGRIVAVTGATGNVGRPLVQLLLEAGWTVRALTRAPDGDAARALAARGAEVVRADLDDRPSLDEAFAGAHAVFSIQNPWICGFDHELDQGKAVADAAKAAGVVQVVYAAGGQGLPETGVPQFDNKVRVRDYMQSIGVPFTILYSSPFMELLTEAAFHPPATAWNVMSKVLGTDITLPWICCPDIARAAVACFDDPQTHVGRAHHLIGDLRSLAEARLAFEKVYGRRPKRQPIPVFLFRRMIGNELVIMWEWMRTQTTTWMREESMRPDQENTRALVGKPHTLETWFQTRPRPAA